MTLRSVVTVSLIALFSVLGTAQQTLTSRSAGQAQAAGNVDWPQFNFDPAHDGYNSYETILSPTNVGNVVLKWSYQPAEGPMQSPPVVVNGVLYVSSAHIIGNAAYALYALNADTGAFTWKFVPHGPIWSSPAVVNGMVYVTDVAFVEALDATTGKLIWQHQVASYAAPTVLDGVVYIGSTDNNVYALNATTGALMWTYATSGPIWVEPAVAGGVLYTSSGPGIVYAVNAATGALIWKQQFGSSLVLAKSLYTSQGGQAVANGVLYVGVQTAQLVYYLYALDAGTGKTLWRSQVGPLLLARTTPAVANGSVYVVSADPSDHGLIYAWDAITGALVWQTGVYMQGLAASPTVANGVVYVASGEGGNFNTGYATIAALDASTGQLLWNQTSYGPVYNLSSPAIVNGTIYGSTASPQAVNAWALPN